MKLFIHIGMPKCASTSFQLWCAASRGLLAAKGVLYPGTTPENGVFLCDYLKNTNDQTLQAVINNIADLVELAHSTGLDKILISSEQIFEYSDGLDLLASEILARVSKTESISVLLIRRDEQSMVSSAWKQAVYAAGEVRKLAQYSEWLIELIARKLHTLNNASHFTLAFQDYRRDMNFMQVVSSFCSLTDLSLDHGKLNALSGHANAKSDIVSNKSFADTVYEFWHYCNRLYGIKSWLFAELRHQLLERNRRVRGYMISHPNDAKTFKLLLVLEGAAIQRAMHDAPVQRAVMLVNNFLTNESHEKKLQIIEFLLVNTDYLYHKDFGAHHISSIENMMSGCPGRTLSLGDFLFP